MKPSGRSLLFWTFARVAVGLILAYAGLSKLMEPVANFQATLAKYGVFPLAWIPWMARTVPWFEWILGSFLIVGYAPRFASLGGALLTLSFLITLGSSRLFLESGSSDCGCFGQSGLHLSLRQIFMVDLVNFLVLLRLSRLPFHPGSLHNFLVKQNGGGDDIKRRPT